MLSLDGGGVRGAVAIGFLERLEKLIEDIEEQPLYSAIGLISSEGRRPAPSLPVLSPSAIGPPTCGSFIKR
jgi:hypothetical protein